MKSKQVQTKKIPSVDGVGSGDQVFPVNEISVDLTTPTQVSKDNALDPLQDSPKMPHERDQSVDMTGGIQSKEVQQAAKDIKNGLKDTSRAPEADAAYQKQK